jgi:hypothetical protein
MSEERRKNYRCPPSGDGETVVLRRDGVAQTAKLVNLSAEGFRLCLDVDAASGPAVNVGDVTVLATKNGSHRVRVANVQRENESLQLGLQRLSEISRPAVAARHASTQRAIFGGRRNGSPSSSPVVQFGVVVAVIVLVAVAVNLWLMAPGNSDEPAAPENARVPATHELEAKSKYPRLGQRAPALTQTTPTSSTANVASPAGSKSTNAEALAGQNKAIFDPQIDPTIKIVAALKRATRENKRVLVEFGAEKSGSCYRLRDFIAKNAEFAATFQKDFVLVTVDSTANQKLFDRFVPAENRHDVPFLTLLDKDGRVVKSQQTTENAGSQILDIEKVKAFLEPPSRAE